MLLPLDIWRAEMGLNPWHFWGMAHSRLAPINASCSGLTFEYSWQGADAAGREDIRRATLRAEERLRTYLGYRVAPEYTEATVDWPRASGWTWGLDASGRRVATIAPEGYVLAIGVEQRELLGTYALTPTDADHDGLVDTFTLSVPTDATDPAEIAVYVAANDRVGGAAVSERWRVQPVSVSIANGIATITGRAWLLVRPALYQSATLQALDPTNNAIYLGALEVYRRTTNAGGTTVDDCQATLIYESGQCCTTSDPATTYQAIARAGIRDSRLGLVTPAAAVYDATSASWSGISSMSCIGEPDRVRLRYLAGYPLGADGQMDARMQSIVAMFAAAELKRRISACRDANERLHDLQLDLTLQATETERYSVSARDLDNPFGVRKGHVQAWRAASDLYLRRGTTA